METLALLDTAIPGGVEQIGADELLAMQQGDYVLRVHGGRVTQVPAEKSYLPADPQGHPQGQQVAQTADGTIYALQHTVVCKSTDGARTWSRLPDEFPEHQHWTVRRDGVFLRATMPEGPGSSGRGRVWQSHDQGATWQKLSQFNPDLPDPWVQRYTHWGLQRLADDTLVFGMDVDQGRYEPATEPKMPDKLVGGVRSLYHMYSTDDAKSWTDPIKVADWCSEGGIAILPDGKWLATIRYGRPRLDDDPLDVCEQITSHDPAGVNVGYRLYKHLFLVESHDRGRSWCNLRQLCTVFGQCYGYPAAVGNTVAVLHDTRYGPNPQSGRALVSHDGGDTWEDETYYVYYGISGSGYSRNVTLDDGTILTVAGISNATNENAGSWDSWRGKTTTVAVRWRPVKT